MITLNGKIQPLVDWAQQTGLKATTITARINRGWDEKKALTTPLL